MTDPQQPGWDPTWQRPDQTNPASRLRNPHVSMPAIEPQYGQPQYAQPQYPPTEYQQAQYPQAQYPQGQYPQAQYQQYPPAQYAQPQYAQPAYVVRPTNSLAIAALVCSLAGLAVGISAPVGAILGHMARKQIAQTRRAGRRHGVGRHHRRMGRYRPVRLRLRRISGRCSPRSWHRDRSTADDGAQSGGGPLRLKPTASSSDPHRGWLRPARGVARRTVAPIPADTGTAAVPGQPNHAEPRPWVPGALDAGLPAVERRADQQPAGCDVPTSGLPPSGLPALRRPQQRRIRPRRATRRRPATQPHPAIRRRPPIRFPAHRPRGTRGTAPSPAT